MTDVRSILKRFGILLAVLFLITCLCAGCGSREGQDPEKNTTQTTASEEKATTATTEEETSESKAEQQIDRDGSYDSREDVALFLYIYGELPHNYITKKEARKLGWNGGSVERYAPGCCIGGDHYGNYERLLPDGDYRECDIGTLGKDSRGAKRIIWSGKDIYYTDDHYRSFEQLYDRDGRL